jgi:predicted secreted protein
MIIEYRVGIVQLPCPELLFLGLNRSDENGFKRGLLIENTRIRKSLEKKTNKCLLKIKAQEIVKTNRRLP